jgi:hypothetical protein
VQFHVCFTFGEPINFVIFSKTLIEGGDWFRDIPKWLGVATKRWFPFVWFGGRERLWIT